MLLAGLIVIATALTATMFASKSSMLGFPCLIFWAIMGGYCYQQSTATWDIYYLTFFASFGMGIFSMFAAYALRTKKEEAKEGDSYFDEGRDRDVKFIDEQDSELGAVDAESESESSYSHARTIRDRARRRREALIRRRESR